MTLRELQDKIHRTYYERDSQRGLERTFMWFIEEVGELARLLKSDQRNLKALQVEFSDVLAWLLGIQTAALSAMNRHVNAHFVKKPSKVTPFHERFRQN